MRVFFTGGGTGGHLYPALAIAQALVRRRPDVAPFFIGATRGIERELLPGTGFAHVLLDLHPLYRSAPLRNWRTLGSLVSGWRAVRALARAEQPPLVVATGGYASGATLAWATLARVPFVMQEQNSFPGRTVKLFSRWAREIYLGFPEAAALLPAPARPRCLDTGNPIVPPPVPTPDRAAARTSMGFGPGVRFVVLAFGGSQGSRALNALLDAWVAAGLPAEVGLIWATGRSHYERHAGRQSAQVAVRAYLSPIAGAYAAADVAIARAGAMTTAELCAWGIPMFLVPLPTAAEDHQSANARALAGAGAAEWVAERDATPAHVARFVEGLRSDAALYARRAGAASARARPAAADRIAERIAALLPMPSAGRRPGGASG